MENLALSDIQKQCRMGRCCRICDRKFFLRASFQNHATQINHYHQEASKVSMDLNGTKAEIEDLENQKVAVLQMIGEEEKRY